MNRCFFTLLLVFCIVNGFAQSYKVKDNDLIVNDKDTTYCYENFCTHGMALFELKSSSKWDDIFYIYFEALASSTYRCGSTDVFKFENGKIFLLSTMMELNSTNNDKFYKTDTSRFRWLVIHKNEVIPADGDNFQSYISNFVFLNEKNDTILLGKNGSKYISQNIAYDGSRILVLFEDGAIVGEISGVSANTGTETFLDSLYTIGFSSLSEIKNVAKWNDIGYYLEQGHFYRMAVELLEKVTEKVPGRVVAWLNLADAYWGLGNEVKSQICYQTYLKLMESQHKDLKRIPKRVYDRSKNWF